MDEPTITGTDVLRWTVKARNKSPHALSLIVREIEGVGPGALEDFAVGKVDLGVEALQALTKILHPHAEFDVETGMLRSANKAPVISMPANYPPSIGDPTLLPTYQPPRPYSGFNLPPSPKPKKRPGWLGGWL